MPKLPRAERSVALNPTPQPTLSPAGFGAAGRGLERAGLGLGALAREAAAEREKLESFKFKAASVDLENDVRLGVSDAADNIQGDGTSLMKDQLPVIDSKIAAFKQAFPDRANEADFVGKRLKGSATLNLHNATKTHARSYIEGEVSRLLTENVGPLVTADFATVLAALRAGDSMIEGAESLTEVQRRRLKAQNAELILKQWLNNADPEDAVTISKEFVKQSPEDFSFDADPKILAEKASRGVRLKGLNDQFESRVSAMLNAMPDKLLSSVKINSGFRDAKQQAEIVRRKLKERGKPVTAAALRKGLPGIVSGVHVDGKGKITASKSRHGAGEALDISGSNAALEWMHRQGPRFGVVNPPSIRKSDPVHFQMIRDGKGATSEGFARRGLIQGQGAMVIAAKKAVKARQGMELVASVISGDSVLNPYDSETRKSVNEAFENAGLGQKMQSGDLSVIDTAIEAVQKLRYAPKDIYQGFRGLLASRDSRAQIAALTAINNIVDRAPYALDGHEGAKSVIAKAESFRHLVADQGLTSEDALKRMDEMATPEFKAQRKVRRADIKGIVDDIDADDLADIFDPGLFSIGPDLNSSPNRALHFLNSYREMIGFHLSRTGDLDLSQKLAKKDFMRRHGVTNMLGRSEVMAFPPERMFPAVGGSHDYLNEQILADVKQAAELAVDEDDIFIHADRLTGQQVAAAGLPGATPPTYIVIYKDENGLFQRVPGRWTPDIAGEQIKFREKFSATREARSKGSGPSAGIPEALLPHNLLQAASRAVSGAFKANAEDAPRGRLKRPVSAKLIDDERDQRRRRRKTAK